MKARRPRGTPARTSFPCLALAIALGVAGPSGARAQHILHAGPAGLDGTADLVDFAVDPARPVIYAVEDETGALVAYDLSAPDRPEVLFRYRDPVFEGAGAGVAAGRRGVAVLRTSETTYALSFLNPEGAFVARRMRPGRGAGLVLDPQGARLAVLTAATPEKPGGIDLWTLGEGEPRFDGAYDFTAFDGAPPAGAARVAGRDWSPAAGAFTADGAALLIAAPGANVGAVLDVAAGEWRSVFGFGARNFSSQPFDASDEDAGVALRPWPVQGLRQPGALAILADGEETRALVLETGLMGEATGRVGDLDLDPFAFDDPQGLLSPGALGRLMVAADHGDVDADGDLDFLIAHGGRGVSVWAPDGRLLHEDGGGLEAFAASDLPARTFNRDRDGVFDGASDESGPRPSAVTVGRRGEARRAYVTLPEMEAVAIYDVDESGAPHLRALFSVDAASAASPLRAVGLMTAEQARGAHDLLILAGDGPEALRVVALHD